MLETIRAGANASRSKVLVFSFKYWICRLHVWSGLFLLINKPIFMQPASHDYWRHSCKHGRRGRRRSGIGSRRELHGKTVKTAADLERVTDYAEEKEISSSDLETAMSVIGDRRSREQKAKQERERELAKVTIKKDDVELIMTEMEIPRGVAERSLREHMGNVVEALIALTN
ncbi:UNVERIFIED_CONTAM: hypothetical protein FKN15_043925 [Acipenser sinensis]